VNMSTKRPIIQVFCFKFSLRKDVFASFFVDVIDAAADELRDKGHVVESEDLACHKAINDELIYTKYDH
jgi:hypothetical protein